ncbi:MAG: hypothetical protein KUG59_04630, partial [Parvibaculaceae bacterium]|nr:hypothetical protein [Parvibaculaceae bacterium]
MTSTSLIRATTRAALLGTTALVASASGAQAIDYIVNAEETSTFILGLGSADTLTINDAGEINSVSPGVAVIDLADSITITDTTGVGAEIDADAVGIEIEGATTDLTGGISIAAGAIVTATTTGAGTAGTGILVQTGADISGGIDNSGAITGYEVGIAVEDSASISGGLVNSGSIYGSAIAISLGDSPTASSTMGAITNNATGVIGVNSAGDSVANFGIGVGGSGSDITGLINNAGSIVGSNTAISSTAGGDISGGITNTNLIGQAATSGGSTTASVGISATNSGDI